MPGGTFGGDLAVQASHAWGHVHCSCLPVTAALHICPASPAGPCIQLLAALQTCHRARHPIFNVLSPQTGRNVVHGSDSPENGERETGAFQSQFCCLPQCILLLHLLHCTAAPSQLSAWQGLPPSGYHTPAFTLLLFPVRRLPMYNPPHPSAHLFPSFLQRCGLRATALLSGRRT